MWRGGEPLLPGEKPEEPFYKLPGSLARGRIMGTNDKVGSVTRLS